MAFFYGQILVQVANEITEPLLLPIFIALYGRRRHDHSVDTEAGINGLIRKVIISGGDVRRSKGGSPTTTLKPKEIDPIAIPDINLSRLL